MARRLRAEVSCLLVLGVLLLQAEAVPASALRAEAEDSLPQALLRVVEVTCNVSSSQQLLEALNSTAGSSTGQLIRLTDDIYITSEDVRAFQPWLPLNGGKRAIVLLGAAKHSGANLTVLDFGGSVNLMYHPAGHAFYIYRLTVQGLAPAASGYAAGLTSQMVNGVAWPTITGEPKHLMAYWQSTIRTVSPSCSANSTHFKARALHSIAGRTDTITVLDANTIAINQQLNGTFPVRDTSSGDMLGNVRLSFHNTTIHCTQPEAASLPAQPSNAAAEAAAQLVARHTAATGIAGNADQLLSLLNSSRITHVVLAGHMSLGAARWESYNLPITLGVRHITIRSNDDQLRVLDLGGCPHLLSLSANSSLSFRGVRLQGAAPPSAALSSRATAIRGSPLWPTVDGEAGHAVSFQDSMVLAITTPCSRNSTATDIALLKKALGEDGVQALNSTGYVTLPRYRRRKPITDTLTGAEVGSATYTSQNTIWECEGEDGIDPASELQSQQLSSSSGVEGRVVHRADAPLANSTNAAVVGSSSSSSSGGTPKWLVAVAVSAGAALALVAGAAALFMRRRRRRRRWAAARQVARAGPAADGGNASIAPPAGLAPLTPLSSKLERMESGDGKLGTQLNAGAAPSTEPKVTDSSSSKPSLSLSKESSSTTELTRAQSLEGGGCQDPVWRTRFGVIEGLEVGDLLGRGAYGKVYLGRWNGAVVAVKVVEHRIAAGDGAIMSREPLLCMSVSHPNCISTYKLSAIRLLHCHDLLDDHQGTGADPQRLSNDSEHTDATSAGSLHGGKGGRQRGRRLRSLLSGAEAVEVADPYGALLPGLYETWILSEYCDRGTLGDMLAGKKLTLPDGRPNLISINLCLLDVASGMYYLHSQGIMHSDLKPANVLLKGVRNSGRGFVCKLADFGLSRMLDGRATHVETGSYGTPTHAAPELLREGRLSPAVDVFAFGVLTWELVAGEEAWAGMHPMQVIVQVTHQGARPPPLPHCPPSLLRLRERCWQEDPAERPTFQDLLPQLREHLQALRQEQRSGMVRVSLDTTLAASAGSLAALMPATPGDSSAPAT